MLAPGSELFISDLHLSAQAPHIAALFFDFMQGPARCAQRLVILGDLFDYWAGDDDLDEPFNARIVSALRNLADSGTAIDFMAGNRDFLVGADFAGAAGINLLPDPCLRKLGGVPTLLTHGDALCTDDVEYQHFRQRVRSKEWRAAFLSRPLAERKADIEILRARSEAEKKTKPLDVMDVNEQSVSRLLHEHGAQAIIHGHTHRQGYHPHSGPPHSWQRWVLGDWHRDRRSILAFDGLDWRWIE